MREECPGVDLRREFAKFTDHWTAAPGSRGVKLDWTATWRNWIRKAYEDLGNGRGSPNGAGRYGAPPEQKATYHQAIKTPAGPTQ